MSDDLHFEIQQAREAFSRLGRATAIDTGLASRYLDAAVAASEGTDKRDWDSLFRFWRTMIQGGWRCPACGGEMQYGEASGVRCKTWQCVWVPGQRR